MSGWPQCSGRARRGGLCSAADGSAVTASQCGTSPGATSATVTGSALHGDREPGSALRVPNRAHGPGECRASLPWGPKSGQAGAGHGPLDNCSSQPFLISGEISRVPAQRDAHRDKVLRKQLTMPLRWQGQGRAAAGVTLALALPPLSLSPVLHLPCSALSTADDTDSPPSPPSLAAVGCAVGPWGPWSGCSSRCGAGSRARSRQVTVPPRHGGDPCPDLKQRRGCLGQHPTCGTAKAALLPEVAKIVPRAFSQDFRDPWRRAGLPLPEPSGWEPRAAGTPGAAGCAGASGCVCSAGGTRPAAAPTAPGTGCQEPGHFGWLLLWWGAKARGCRRACRRAVSAPNQLSSSCRIPLGRFAAHPWCQLPLFSIKYFAEE
ncbi:SCO-spondin-like isoform X1 [Prinia subflava]|uniref:SCO-spondin-like isoform X1 n=1 Tax=Prinia subflava TaxID=208062 RepID=UPI002FE1F0E8